MADMNQVALQGSKVEQFNVWGALQKQRNNESVYQTGTSTQNLKAALSDEQGTKAGEDWVQLRPQGCHDDVLDLRNMLNLWKAQK